VIPIQLLPLLKQKKKALLPNQANTEKTPNDATQKEDQIENLKKTASPKKIARSKEDIERIKRLIQASIGFNNQRGDIVSVESFPFIRNRVLPDPPAPPFYEHPLFERLLKPFVGLLLGIILILKVFKPVFHHLFKIPLEEKENKSENEKNASSKELSDANGNASNSNENSSGSDSESVLLDDQVTLSGHTNLELPPPTVGEIKKLEQAKAVVENNPTLVAQLVKGWIEEDANAK
jgi:flagellar M-ring protein FliF